MQWQTVHIECFISVKYPKGKWNAFPWLRRKADCEACKKDKVCGQKICVNDNGHAKTFESVCEATSYLRKKRQLKLVAIALGECKALFSSKYYIKASAPKSEN